MQYVEMSIEEALKIFKGDVSKTVLVAVKDLEKDDDIQSFEKVGKTGRYWCYSFQ